MYKRYKILRIPHGYFPGGVIDSDIFPTVTTRTGDAQQDVILEIYECDSKENILTPTKVSIGMKAKRSTEDNTEGGGISRCVKTDDSLAVMVITNVVAVGRQRTEEEKARRRIHGDKGAKFSQGKELCLLGDVSGCITTAATKDNLIAEIMEESILIPEATAKGYAEATEGDSVNLEQPSSKTRRGRVGKQMANTLTTSCNQGVVVSEPKVVENWQTVLGSKQHNSYIGSTEECSSCITSACGAGGGMTPMLTDAPLETAKTKEFFEQVRGHEPMRYRIRKLTPRECFRLMDVDDNIIDKIQAAGISNSQQYKIAGNSIVVACLYGIFEQLFFPKYTNSGTLF